MISGSIVAIITPFKNGKIDERKLAELVDFQVKNGTSGIVPCGTTGESPTLSNDEHRRVIDICIAAAKRRVPVIAGTGSNSTEEAIALTRHASDSGADAALVVSPYYNKPTQKGLYLHFKAIAEAVPIPIILYNIVGRTACNIEPSTMAQLATDCKNIIGVKEASGSLAQMQNIKQLCPKDFLLLSGDDALLLPLLSIGGKGVISVAANIVPRDVAAVISHFTDGNMKGAQEAYYRLLPLVQALFLETNPIPVKAAMGMIGLCSDELRLPLSPMEEPNRAKLKKVLIDYKLIT